MLDCVKSVVLACVCFWLSGCQFHMVSSREARPSAWRPLSSGGQSVCVCVCVYVCVCVCVVGGCVVFLAQQATGLRVCRAACRPLVCCLGPHRSSLRQQCCELGLPPFVKQTPSHHCGCAPWAPSRRCDESRTFQNLGWKERGQLVYMGGNRISRCLQFPQQEGERIIAGRNAFFLGRRV